MPEIIEHVPSINPKHYIVQSAKELPQEILMELIPSGYLHDEILIRKLLENEKLPKKWEIFLPTLFNAKNHVTAIVIYQGKNTTENKINIFKLKCTVKQFEYDFQIFFHFKASIEPSLSNYVDSSCLLTADPFQEQLSCENSLISTVEVSSVLPQPHTSKDVVYNAMRNPQSITTRR